MSKTYETSYAKNVANFENLLSKVQEFGDQYNPSWSAIQLSNLTDQLNKARQALDELNAQLAMQKGTITARNTAFLAMKKLATRVLSAAKSLNITPQEIDNLKSLNRNIQGSKSTKAPTETITTEAGETITKRHISNSHQGFDSLLDAFQKLIKQLASIPQYRPNEGELSTAVLESYYIDLLTKNQEVILWNTNISSSRISRNAILFKEKEGLSDLSKAVKNYIKSLCGSEDPRYKQISKISIRTT